MTFPSIDLSFPHRWQAEILAARPLILPPRHYVYPRQAEEIERGALEVLVTPFPAPEQPGAPAPALSLPKDRDSATWDSTAAHPAVDTRPFLATCALGFRDAAVPTGLWAAPNADEICAVSGGYAYVIRTNAPEIFTMIAYRPVLEVRPVVEAGLLLFVGHHAILAWGKNGEAWQSEKLSAEGVTVTSVENGILRGLGWDLMTDRETPFALDLRTGLPARI
jgi:hypothetical protein